MSASDTAVVVRWKAKLKVRDGLLAYARRQNTYWTNRYHSLLKKEKGKPASPARGRAYKMLKDRRSKVALRESQVSDARKVIERHTPQELRLLAYNQAVKLIGVMESGGNNQGSKVSEIIKANGGSGPEPWCGDFVAYVYRKAGSKAVTRSWASVALLGSVLGVTKTSKPLKGDLVRFNFDHVGMFVKDNGDGTIETIEGNTGSAGAVSDGNGSDGVYRKVRSKSLVLDYRRVTK